MERQGKRRVRVKKETNDESPSSSVTKVFQINPLNIEYIMESILAYLPTLDLKKSRLVCQLWNREGAKILVHRKYSSLEFSAINYKRLSATIPELRKCLKTFDMDFHVNAKLQGAIDASKISNYPQLLRAFKIPCWSMMHEMRKEYVRSHGKYLKQIDIGLTKHSWEVTDSELLSRLGTLAPNLSKLKFFDSSYGLGHPGEEHSGTAVAEDSPVTETTPIIISLHQLIVILTSYKVEEYALKLEKRCLEICKTSPNLKSLQLEYCRPVSFLKNVFQLNRVRERLEKLSVRVDAYEHNTMEYLHTVSLPRLRVLCLSGGDIAGVHLENVLRNFSNTLTKLKIVRILSEPTNEDVAGVIIKFIKLLPRLEYLNWSQNFYKRNYKLFFKDLKDSGIVHEEMKCLKLKQISVLERQKPVAFDLVSLRNAFPNLRQLDLVIRREQADFGLRSRTRSAVKNGLACQTELLTKEMEGLNMFTKLEKLTIIIDEFSIGADVFEAISTLEKSTTLQNLSVVNLCKNCITLPYECGHRLHCTKEKMQKMLLRLKKLNSIHVGGFYSFFIHQDNSHANFEQIIKFAQRNAIRLNAQICETGFGMIGIINEELKFDSDDETEVD